MKKVLIIATLFLSVIVFGTDCFAAKRVVYASVRGYSGSATTRGIVHQNGILHKVRCDQGKVKSRVYYTSNNKKIVVGTKVSVSEGEAKHREIRPDYNVTLYAEIETAGIFYDAGTVFLEDVFDYVD